MVKYLSFVVVVAFWALVAFGVGAQADSPPCGSFKKLPNGKWTNTKAIKIEHGDTSSMMSPGTTIGPGTRIAGVDIYAALEQSCH
jgi:hypothetical protein